VIVAALRLSHFEWLKDVRLDGSGDGLGAKLVWSPLSNLLLYGQTALVYDALKAGVLVLLGTDWSPSGSRHLLDELNILLWTGAEWPPKHGRRSTFSSSD
jgi:cytosine/adenosine deaminase-related metal-dependent hydrolase